MAVQISWRRKRLVLNFVVVTFFIVVSGLWACTGKKTKEQYPVSKEPGGPYDPLLVKKLYDVKCAICHGFDGRQQYAGAKNLGESRLSDDEVFQQISEGKGAMPPQKDVLSEDQIKALTELVKTFRLN